MMKKLLYALSAVAVLAVSACTQEELDKFLNDGKEIPATSITINVPDGTDLKVGETLTLTATVEPENTTDKVEWESLMPENATVKDGVVTALKEGFASIVAKAGKVQATCRLSISKADDGGNGDAVTELKLDEEEIHMSPGQVWTLSATVKPESASISWSSSRTEVATVDQEGKVTAVALGETVITASAGDKSAQCLVKVEREVAIVGISLNETSLTMKEGETFQLIATLLPQTATPKPVEWVSSIPAVATVDEKGLVTAVRNGGPANIWAIVKTDTGYEISAKCEVTVTGDGPSIEGIEVTPSTVTINATESTILTATVTPEGADVEINWFSDNTTIATVEKISNTEARVTGVGIGTTKVVASVGNVFDYSEVTVEKKSSGGGGEGGGVELIALNKTELNLSFYQTEQLIATLRPEDASAVITWTSSNEDVALVSNGSTPGADGSIMPAGTVIAKNKEGQSVITASVGSLSASCTVTVSSGSVVPVESISLNKTELTLQVGESFQLVATLTPQNATTQQVSWSMTARSSQLSMTTDGLKCVIGALAECEATITVRSGDNPSQLYATCKVTVTGGGGSGSGDEAVDLGLPSGKKWRSMNVGASKPEDYGDYFAWGETGTKTSYTWSNYKFGSYDEYGEGAGKKGSVLLPEDDAATKNVGSEWRTPKMSEWKELKEKCTWTWTTRNGVKGMQVKGSNGNSIFLPAGGNYGSSKTYVGTQGHYWSASYYSDDWAQDVEFKSDDVNYGLVDRSVGRSIRPIKD